MGSLRACRAPHRAHRRAPAERRGFCEDRRPRLFVVCRSARRGRLCRRGREGGPVGADQPIRGSSSREGRGGRGPRGRRARGVGGHRVWLRLVQWHEQDRLRRRRRTAARPMSRLRQTDSSERRDVHSQRCEGRHATWISSRPRVHGRSGKQRDRVSHQLELAEAVARTQAVLGRPHAHALFVHGAREAVHQLPRYEMRRKPALRDSTAVPRRGDSRRRSGWRLELERKRHHHRRQSVTTRNPPQAASLRRERPIGCFDSNAT